jgi:LmbE family N-acetylglucosaminyl deacetylase
MAKPQERESGIVSKKTILVLAAHPDDEVLGCGGTIALHARGGDDVVSVVVCEGESLRYGAGRVGQPEHARAAAQTLGVRDLRMLGFGDQRLDTVPLTAVIDPLLSIVREVRPEIVYCQHGGDVNRDHQLLFQAALVATRPTEGFICGVYAFDTASSTEWAYPRTFVPDTWVDISSTLQVKLDAMACYKSEVRPYPHPRSLEALSHRAKAWGNQSCLDAAETFMTVRRIWRDGQAPV